MKGLKYLISLQDKVSSVADRIGGKVKALVGKMDSLTSVQEKVERSSGKAARGLDGMSSSMGRFLKVGTLAAGLSIASTIGSIGQQVIGVGKQFVDSSLDMQNSMRIINSASGGESAKNMSFLKDTIDKFNVPLKETSQGFSQLASAFDGSVLAGKPLRDLFEGVSMVSIAKNLKPAAVEGIFKVFTDMSSDSVIHMEELNGQLKDHLPGAMRLAAKAMNMSEGSFRKFVEQGKIASTDFIPKFSQVLKDKFGKQALEAAELPQGQLTKLANKFELLKIGIGDRLMPVVLKVGIVLMDVLDRAMPLIDTFSSAISQGFSKISPLFAILGSLLQQITVPAQNLWNSFAKLFDLVFSFFLEINTGFASSVNWGGILAGIFDSLTIIISTTVQVLSRLFTIIKPLYNLLAKVVGFIVDAFGSYVNVILRGTALMFEFIGSKVSWLYDNIIAFMKLLGLVDKSKVSVTVEKVNKAASPFGSTAGGLDPNAFAKTNGTGTAPAGAGTSGDKINQGGSRPININIKYDAMNKGGITIQTTNIKEGVADVQKMLEEMLLRTLNGATQLATK